MGQFITIMNGFQNFTVVQEKTWSVQNEIVQILIISRLMDKWQSILQLWSTSKFPGHQHKDNNNLQPMKTLIMQLLHFSYHQ